jgi:hypothetical protein
MTNSLHRNNKFITVHNKCSKIPPSTSMHFVTRAKTACCTCFFMREAASKTRASNRLVHPPSFCELHSSSHPTSKSLTHQKRGRDEHCVRDSSTSVFGNHSQLVTCSHELFFSQWPILSPQKIMMYPLESPCIIIGINDYPSKYSVRTHVNCRIQVP